MEIFKFGGTSIASSEAIKQVVTIINNYKKTDKGIIIVVSAIDEATDKLSRALDLAVTQEGGYQKTLEELKQMHKDIANSLFPGSQLPEIIGNINLFIKEGMSILNGLHLIKEITARAEDQVLSLGERMSAYLISEYLKLHYEKLHLYDAVDLVRVNSKTRNVDLDKTNANIYQAMSDCSGVGIIPGFIAGTENNIITTLGRGGSDYTAALVAEALGAKKITIWTDVDGIYTTDPRIVPTAFSIKELSYEEALELSHFGAQVLYPPTILPALRGNIPIHIRNSSDTVKEGTVIQSSSRSGHIVKGISNVDNISILLIIGAGMVGVTGTSSRAFNALSQHNINVVFVSQSSSEHSICIGVSTDQGENAVEALRDEFSVELELSRVEDILLQNGFSVIALVGNNMNHTPGVSGKMFGALGRNGINIHAIAQGASERNISAILKTSDAKKALNLLHEEFFLSDKKQVHIFIAGTGNVGQQLLNLFVEQYEYLKEELDLVFRLVGITNSRKKLIEPAGIPWENAIEKLEEHGEKADFVGFADSMKELNLRNTIFVDNTASAEVSSAYSDILINAISIATCNKISASSGYNEYSSLKKIARRNNVNFLFETNVGAGLPLLSTLHDLLKTGDKINRVEAVLSGTMNYIFNKYCEGNSFYDSLNLAMDAGFTEPDPRIDLFGTDVKRKILIIAREAGYRLNLEDVKMQSYLPDECNEKETVEEFMEVLKNNQDYFSRQWDDEIQNGNRLRMVAVLDKGKASVEIKPVGHDHPAYELHGADNIILLKTRWYKDTPLVIQGAGAGAEVTASGVLNDVIKTANI